jgi:hypothetical protein
MITFGVVWVGRFRGDCNRSTPLNSCDDIANGFAAAMIEEGHRCLFNLGNDEADMKYWISHKNNYSKIGKDNDPSKGVNSVNFALIATHGAFNFANKPKEKIIKYGYFMTFGTDDCQWHNVYTRLGDSNRLKWIVFDACNSMQLPPPDQGIIGTREHPNTIPESIYQDVNPTKIWHHCFFGLHMIFGFTGFSSDSYWTNERGYDFAQLVASGDKLYESWLDEAFSYWCNDYPVVMACGRTAEEANERLYKERISSKYNDIPHEKILWYSYHYRVKR